MFEKRQTGKGEENGGAGDEHLKAAAEGWTREDKDLEERHTRKEHSYFEDKYRWNSNDSHNGSAFDCTIQ